MVYVCPCLRLPDARSPFPVFGEKGRGDELAASVLPRCGLTAAGFLVPSLRTGCVAAPQWSLTLTLCRYPRYSVPQE